MTNQKEKIAILGGGLSSLTTAYYLTKDPNWKENYEIDIYHMGWRLGGKGASGRNPDFGQRIEEHGLHIWFGFYDNAFRLMRDVYEELERPLDIPLSRFEEAFKPANTYVLEEFVNGEWKHWPIKFPNNKEVPGIEKNSLTLDDYLEFILDWLIEYYQEIFKEVRSRYRAKRNSPIFIRLQRCYLLPNASRDGGCYNGSYLRGFKKTRGKDSFLS